MGKPFLPNESNKDSDPIKMAQNELVSAISSLNMSPTPIENPEGFYLSETDHMAKHSQEHIQAAFEWLIKANLEKSSLQHEIWKLGRKLEKKL